MTDQRSDRHQLHPAAPPSSQSNTITSTSTSAPFSIPPALFHPNIMTENLPNSDPLSLLITKNLPHPRPPRDLSGDLNVPNLESFDITAAIQHGRWRQVATFSRLCILSLDPNLNPSNGSTTSQERLATVLQYWSLRFIALVRLRLHGIVEEEINRLWNVLQGSENASLLDSPFIPFELYIVRARSPRNLNADVKGTIDRLWEVLRACKTRETQARGMEKRLSKKKESEHGGLDLDDQIRQLKEIGQLWKDRKNRCRLLIAGYMAEMKDYPSCISILEPISSTSDPRLLSLISRLHLQAGSLSSSSQLIQSANLKAQERIVELESTLKSSEKSREEGRLARSEIFDLKHLVVTNEALLSISRGDFQKSKQLLENFHKENQESLGKDGDGNLTSLLNNLAISTFYVGELEKPLEILESLLQESPFQVTSAESLIFNLTTFHELRREDSMKDKIRILTLVAQWAGEGISSSSLKLA